MVLFGTFMYVFMYCMCYCVVLWGVLDTQNSEYYQCNSLGERDRAEYCNRE